MREMPRQEKPATLAENMVLNEIMKLDAQLRSKLRPIVERANTSNPIGEEPFFTAEEKMEVLSLSRQVNDMTDVLRAVQAIQHEKK